MPSTPGNDEDDKPLSLEPQALNPKPSTVTSKPDIRTKAMNFTMVVLLLMALLIRGVLQHKGLQSWKHYSL